MNNMFELGHGKISCAISDYSHAKAGFSQIYGCKANANSVNQPDNIDICNPQLL